MGGVAYDFLDKAGSIIMYDSALVFFVLIGHDDNSDVSINL